MQANIIDSLRKAVISNGIIITDIDDTIKENHYVDWSDKRRKIYPSAIVGLYTLMEKNIEVIPVTEQSVNEFRPFANDLNNLVKATLFQGFIGEGGCVAKIDGRTMIIPTREEIESLRKIKNWLSEKIVPLGDDGWGRLPGINLKTPLIKLPEENEQGEFSVSLWKKGPHVGADSKYIELYKMIDDFIQSFIDNDPLMKGVTISEAGNGTARIRPTGVDKSYTMKLLSRKGIIKFPDLIYFCDGPNDLALAKEIKSNNGFVVAVSNAIDELKEIADYVTKLPCSKGFAEVVQLMFPDKFKNVGRELSLAIS